MFDYIQDLELDDDFQARKQLLFDMGWDTKLENTTMFNLNWIQDDTIVHYTKYHEVYALTYLIENTKDNKMVLFLFTVNPLTERKGYGKKTMKEVAYITLDAGYKKLSLSAVYGIDKFYQKLGMKETKLGSMIFIGDEKWLKKMAKGIKF